MAAQKYVILKKRDGLVIDWTPNLHIVSDDMEVFESDVPPPERIPNLLDWKVAQVEVKTAAAVAAKSKKTTAPEAA